MPSPIITVWFTSQKTIILDVEAITTKKTIEKKRNSYIVNVLKEFMGATTITMSIPDFDINLTVNKLIALVLTIKK